MSGICQGITWGRNDDVNSMPAAGAGYADFLSERAWLSANQSGGGNHAGIPFSECSGRASSRTGEKRRHHDKAWRGPGDNASYRGEGRRQRGGRDYPRTACR